MVVNFDIVLPGNNSASLEQLTYCSLQVGCHSQWFMLDSVVSTVDTVWLTLAIHGFSAFVSLIAHALILVRYHKQARAVFTVVQWLCKIASNRSSLLIAMELELERMLSRCVHTM